ncbi:hypothetical protein BJV82DRAFT_604323 [Fennellomyces sp. T-0311]|nr:hypothetical protein BJV82DRAFT_604323 [Fennellomyces sp. T-0311]
MDSKKQAPPPVIYAPTPNESHARWAWVRRFILSLVVLAVVMHCTAPTRLSQLWKSHNEKKEHLVLHTGFPAVGEKMSGQRIQVQQGAAIAFSPNFANAQKESWWDRLFPWRHVHLSSVQLAVHSDQPVSARLAICTSTRDNLWQTIPDASKCIASAELQVLDPADDPGILEWIPSQDEDAIVMRKKNVYWLLVQADANQFDWVYAQPSDDLIGDSRVAYETQNGWKLQEDEMIPSIMITVVDHE